MKYMASLFSPFVFVQFCIFAKSFTDCKKIDSASLFMLIADIIASAAQPPAFQGTDYKTAFSRKYLPPRNNKNTIEILIK